MSNRYSAYYSSLHVYLPRVHLKASKITANDSTTKLVRGIHRPIGGHHVLCV